MTKTNGFAAIALAILCSAYTASPASSSTGDPKQTTSAASQPSSSVPDSRKLKNAPIPSSGCGKELGDFKSGIHTMTSAGLTRQYTIDIPANYDKNKPYRLIFAMHMMGGHMNTMVNNKFYGLKTYADRDNVPVIFVAPEGYTDRFPWRGADDKDHVFFADMLALFKDKLALLKSFQNRESSGHG